jgi:hypothetical protein
MRLLRVSSDEVVLEPFEQKELPPYAILSHTWGEDGEEISYQELVGDSDEYKKKAGYAKLRFMIDQVKKEGLEWLWIDTCCINKESSAELSEAINSMYHWYQTAAVCYAYLDDVSSRKRKRSDATLTPSWQEQFQKSKWFTRGWTLQELLAPRQVKFFDRNGAFLGTKGDLKRTITSITKIPEAVLDGDSLENYSIAQRLAWAASRQTTRAEDRAYCLLGLFGVHMPLLYGERENAFIRLQEEIIKKSNDQTIFAWKSEKRYATHGLLAPSPAAFANSQDIVPIPGTRTTKPFALTQLGLQVRVQLHQHEKGPYAALLDCMDQKTKAIIGIHLVPVGDNSFLRTRLDQFVTARPKRPPRGFVPSGTRTIYVPQQRLAPLEGLRGSDVRRCRIPSSKSSLYRSSANKRPLATALCGMCLRCPASRVAFLRSFLLNSSLSFG